MKLPVHPRGAKRGSGQVLLCALICVSKVKGQRGFNPLTKTLDTMKKNLQDDKLHIILTGFLSESEGGGRIVTHQNLFFGL